jgi:aryl-alcohol dehydrogenase-like predicted oxidoreductase
MLTRPLPHTDLTVSRICLGTMTFGAQTDESAAARMLDECLGAGVQFVDTANIYNDGESERILGRLLRGRRGQVVLASKVRGKWGEAPHQQGLSRAAILAAIDASLERLQTDYLDLYYLHMPDPATPIEETLAAMDSLVRAGKVRHIATSNYAAWQVCRMHSIAERAGLAAPYVSQPMYNLLARGVEQEYLPMCRELGVSTVVYNPLAGGLLTGKHSAAAPIAGSRFDDQRLGRMYRDRYWNGGQFAAVEELRAAAAAAGRSLVSLALNWLLRHSAADSIILGASRIEQLRENLAALEDGPLPDDLLAACDRVWESLRGPAPRYNR